MREEEGGKETTVPFPWFLAVHHQSLAFRARLDHARNETPQGEADREGLLFGGGGGGGLKLGGAKGGGLEGGGFLGGGGGVRL